MTIYCHIFYHHMYLVENLNRKLQGWNNLYDRVTTEDFICWLLIVVRIGYRITTSRLFYCLLFKSSCWRKLMTANNNKNCCAFPECISRNAPLLRCSQCKEVFYCSPEHQKSHWKIHKPVCTTRNNLNIQNRSSSSSSCCGSSILFKKMLNIFLKLKRNIYSYYVVYFTVKWIHYFYCIT